jgi:hypothetical protein
MTMNQKHDRRSIRLPDWDYRSEGYYFVTICTFQREWLFADECLHEIAALAWSHIPQQPHAAHVQLDESVIMPNHTHGILRVTSDPAISFVETNHLPGPSPGSIGAIVGNYKMLVSKRVKATLKKMGKDKYLSKSNQVWPSCRNTQKQLLGYLCRCGSVVIGNALSVMNGN